MSDLHTIRLHVNGQSHSCAIPARLHLVDLLRDELGLKGSHLGCEHGVCGACTVEVDGRAVRGCLTLAVQADGRQALQQSFIKHNALQCGFCTPGMLMAARELVQHKPDATREEVREWMSGNYCRCTGYHAIVDAVCEVLAQRNLESAA